MSERPIIFSAAMIRALLEGRKTQTRRILKPQPIAEVRSVFHHATERKTGRPVFGMRGPMGGAICGLPCKHGLLADIIPPLSAGDLLWVRERFSIKSWDEDGSFRITYSADGVVSDDLYPHDENYMERFCDRIDAAGVKVNPDTELYVDVPGRILNRPSIYMPRWASRITLRVTEVRVQRLQDISEEDAIAEGVCSFAESLDSVGWGGMSHFDRIAMVRSTYGSAVNAYRHLWESLHGAESWETNPWLATVSFERVMQ
jgi:hypothetical protein